MPAFAVRRVPLRAATVVDAPVRSVRTAVQAIDTWTRAATAIGATVSRAGDAPARDALAPGAVLRFIERRRRSMYRVKAPASGSNELVHLAGIGATRGRRVVITAAPSAAGSLVTVEVLGGRRLSRVRTLRRLQVLLGVVTLAATADRQDAHGVEAGSTGRSPTAMDDGAGVRPVVVAGVLVRDDAILAARRTYPPELAGRWECPGGKVEPGEAETDALVRELDEELGIQVQVRERIGPELDIGDGYVLHAYRVELRSGTPSPTVHDALRWVGADEVEAWPWLPSDGPLVPYLRQLLLSGTERADASTPGP